MENKVGIIREFDNLGRLVVPKEMRTLFNFQKEVEIVVTENGVLLRNPEYRLVKIANENNVKAMDWNDLFQLTNPDASHCYKILKKQNSLLYL